MIATDEQLAGERQLLAMLEDGYLSLRRELLPHQPLDFQIFAQGHVEMIRKLRANIEMYLELDLVVDDIEDVAADESVAALS